MKRTQASAVASSSTTSIASGSGKQQPSPRSRRHSQETKQVPTTVNASSSLFASTMTSQHLRSGGTSSAFNPPVRREFDDDEEQRQPTHRDLNFLSANQGEKAKQQPQHSRGGSDYDYEENLFQALPGTMRGNSPNTVSTGMTRPIRSLTQSRQVPPIATATQQVATMVASAETYVPALAAGSSMTPEPGMTNSRPNSPAGFRAQSPPTTTTAIRQPPPSPQLLAMRANSPTTLAGGSYRPQSPTQTVANNNLRPRSQSLDSKGGNVVHPVQGRAPVSSAGMPRSNLPSAPTSGTYTTNTVVQTAVKPIVSKAGMQMARLTGATTASMTGLKQQQPMASHQPPTVITSANVATASTSMVQPPQSRMSPLPIGSNVNVGGGNSATNSPVNTIPILPADILTTLQNNDGKASALNQEQAEILCKFAASLQLVLPQLQFQQPLQPPSPLLGSQSPMLGSGSPSIGSSNSHSHSSTGGATTVSSTRVHHRKDDSLEEISYYFQTAEDPTFWTRIRGGSQDGGRLAPNLKMFESQIPGEETRSTIERKPPSPYPWYASAPAHPPMRDEGSYLKSQPRVPANAADATLANGPDPERRVDIGNPNSAFSLSTSLDGEEDEVKHEDPAFE